MQKCGFVAVVGPPNAGKSTLSNALVGQKVAIVTQKAQTTRARLRAVVMHAQSQVILVDTPGIFEPKQRLDRAMVNEAWLGIDDADEVLLVLDAAHAKSPETEIALERLAQSKKPVSLALNKIDMVARDTLLGLVQKLNEIVAFKDTFLISALSGDGLERFRIEQTVYVRRDGQKAIVLGKGGKTIKDIGAEARKELIEMFGCAVHLFIFVKVRKNWQEDPERYRIMGLDYRA